MFYGFTKGMLWTFNVYVHAINKWHETCSYLFLSLGADTTTRISWDGVGVFWEYIRIFYL